MTSQPTKSVKWPTLEGRLANGFASRGEAVKQLQEHGMSLTPHAQRILDRYNKNIGILPMHNPWISRGKDVYIPLWDERATAESLYWIAGNCKEFDIDSKGGKILISEEKENGSRIARVKFKHKDLEPDAKGPTKGKKAAHPDVEGDCMMWIMYLPHLQKWISLERYFTRNKQDLSEVFSYPPDKTDYPYLSVLTNWLSQQ